MWGVEGAVSNGADVHDARGPRCLPGVEVEWVIGPLNMRPSGAFAEFVTFDRHRLPHPLHPPRPAPAHTPSSACALLTLTRRFSTVAGNEIADCIVTHVGNCLHNEADGNLIALNALAGIPRKSIIGRRPSGRAGVLARTGGTVKRDKTGCFIFVCG
ncbi:hypothetical protein B0H10DRAFT_2239114 [Mycena sp. CBHHK59/15]|nr:hypothetical protein B0H10DRAFT_2239114 [Mycena sp. CBHHK59/15]